jgi:hypothetical protein
MRFHESLAITERVNASVPLVCPRRNRARLTRAWPLAGVVISGCSEGAAGVSAGCIGQMRHFLTSDFFVSITAISLASASIC